MYSSSAPDAPPAYNNGLGLADNVELGKPIAGVSYMGHPIPGSVGSPQGNPSLALASADSARVDCSFGDRFDRDTTLGYNIDSNHQIGFKLAINPSDGGPGGVSHIGINFRWKFSTVKSHLEPPPKEKCRYSSHWQGLVGSTYNELFLRDNNSVWDFMRDRGLNFWH